MNTYQHQIATKKTGKPKSLPAMRIKEKSRMLLLFILFQFSATHIAFLGFTARLHFASRGGVFRSTLTSSRSFHFKRGLIKHCNLFNYVLSKK